MTNAIIILLCMLMGAFATSLLTGNSPIRSDRLITAGIGAASGLIVALVIILVAWIIREV